MCSCQDQASCKYACDKANSALVSGPLCSLQDSDRWALDSREKDKEEGGVVGAGILTDPDIDDPGTTEDQFHSHYESDTGFGCAFFVSRNGFNKHNSYLEMWNVRHRWPIGSWFAFDRHNNNINNGSHYTTTRA